GGEGEQRLNDLVAGGFASRPGVEPDGDAELDDGEERIGEIGGDAEAEQAEQRGAHPAGGGVEQRQEDAEEQQRRAEVALQRQDDERGGGHHHERNQVGH